jgi:hypothetical protein
MLRLLPGMVIPVKGGWAFTVSEDWGNDVPRFEYEMMDTLGNPYMSASEAKAGMRLWVNSVNERRRTKYA